MNSRIYQWIGVFGVLCIYYSCTNNKAEVTPACTPPDTVSFSQHIVPIFNVYCNNTGCHSGKKPKGNLNLEPSVAYAELMKSGSGYIDTLNPRFSLLYASMNSTSSPMPPPEKLDTCKITLILKWIQQKAPSN